MPDAQARLDQPEERQQPPDARPVRERPREHDQVERGEGEQRPSPRIGHVQSGVFEDDLGQSRHAVVDEQPRLDNARAVGSEERRQSATDAHCGQTDDSAHAADRTRPAEGAPYRPASECEAEGRHAAEHPAVGIRPNPIEGDQPAERANSRPAVLESEDRPHGHRHADHREQVRAHVEVGTGGGDGDQRDGDGEDRVQAGADERCGEPREQPGDDGGGTDEQRVQCADAVDAGHGHFAEPLVRDPALAPTGERERIAVEEALVQNLVAADGVPEHAGVAQEAGPPAGEQREPEENE